MRFSISALFFLIICWGVLEQPAQSVAQTSIGFGDPDAVSNLLDYRLPAWSYRVWDLDFDLSGSGVDAHRSNVSHSTQFMTDFGTDFRQNWESEERDLMVGGRFYGAYSRFRTGNSDYEEHQHQLEGSLSIDGGTQLYLGEGPFSILAAAYIGRQYTEDVSDATWYGILEEYSDYRRRSNYSGSAGVGWGRVRNVVPLLRAERLSERLVALGRSRLSSGQVREIADVLAREFAYREVFDRSDRHFWDDVLAPMLEPGNPLSPFDILYLMEVLNENLGERRQGFAVTARYQYRESTSDIRGTYTNSTRQRIPEITFLWCTNPSLSHQINLEASWQYYWTYNWQNSESNVTHLRAYHTWNLADRYRLDTRLLYSIGNLIGSDVKSIHEVTLNSSFNIFLEDQVSLGAGVSVRYGWDEVRDDKYTDWNWSYRLGLTYHLDRTIF